MTIERKVYATFEMINRNGNKIKFSIQNLTDDIYDKILDIMMNKYLKEEVYVRTAGVFNSTEAIKEMRDLYRMIYEKGSPALVCCVDDSEGEVAGCNMLYTDDNGDSKKEIIKRIKQPELRTVLNIEKLVETYYNIFEAMDAKTILSGAGLYVNPEFRGCGIATEILKARKPLCEELKVQLTCAWFTSVGSQKAAAKAGYELRAEVPYEELGEKAGVVFTDVPKFTKLMILKVDVKT